MPFRYPIALDLGGRCCVVIGGAVGEHKVRGLMDAGARVTVVAEAPAAGLEELAAAGAISLLARAYRPGDLDGAFLAIAATDDPATNALIHAEAMQRHVLFNAVDDSAHCDFAAPSVLRRGDLTISVSTAGQAPALAKRLREILSGQFGQEWGSLVELLASARRGALADRGGQRDVDFATWAGRWSDALDHDLIGLIRAGRAGEAAELVQGILAGPLAGSAPGEIAGGPPTGYAPGEIAGAGANGPVLSFPGRLQDALRRKEPGNSGPDGSEGPRGASRPGGRVAIVGAGPGAPDLITLRGRALLDAADVVVYDRLVHSSLWEGKEAIDAGKEPGSHRVAQDDINVLLVRLAREGKRVVRLKGGDPFVFGRGAEEAEVLTGEGIPYEVVPAPTSAVAALAAAGIPVTDRRLGSSVAIVTGHCAAGDGVDWDALATAVDTIVVLMGLRHLDEIVGRLMAGGRAGDTPSAVVSQGTLPGQKVVVAPLRDLAQAVMQAEVQAPAIIVVGEVVTLRARIIAGSGDPRGR